MGSLWKLRINIDGFKSENSDELVTQASIGRSFQLIDCLRSNFKDAYDIDYYRSQKGQGHGHYLLTRKEDNISSARGHEKFLMTR